MWGQFCRRFRGGCFLGFLLWAGGGFAASSEKISNPDFTRGDPIPEGWTHDWTLGPTGLRGWMFSERLTTSAARQIRITTVDEGSPADGVLRVGDVILGVEDKVFDDDPRKLLGQAIARAETEAGQGRLVLLCWREGKKGRIMLQLPVMGNYSATAPFSCAKSQRICERGWEAIAGDIKRNPRKGNAITRAINALALLASGEERYLPLVRQEAEWLSEFGKNTGVRTWHYGYINLFLAEYVLATGDRSLVKDGLQRISQHVVDGQSEVGSWGHGFVVESTGRLGGYGMMNSPGLVITYSLMLAREAGVEVSGLDEAIGKSLRLLRFYVGKGGIPYGDHAPWIQTHCDNGKNDMAAVVFDHQGDAAAAQFYSWMAIAAHGAERDTGHTGNFFNILWALPGVARSGPQASGAWMEEYGWYFDLARRWDGTFVHQGAPGQRPDSYRDWDATGAYLWGYAQASGKTFLTGKKKSVALQIDRKTAREIVVDGRGWTNNDRDSAYDALTTPHLLERLARWSPTVRERAAMALSRRPDEVVPQLVAALGSRELYRQYGACQALRLLRGKAVAAVPALVKTLNADDLWLRCLAAEALAGIGDPARGAVPDLLERMAGGAAESDPRKMEERFLAFALFNQRGGLLARSLEGVDRDLLARVVRSVLLNDDGRARSSLSTVYRNLSYEEIRPLFPEVHQAIVKPAPSGIMFANGIRDSGLELFAKYRISAGIELLADYVRNMKKHGSQKRIITVLKMLESYGAHAQRVIPHLEETAAYFDAGEENFPKKLSKEKARMVRDSIQRIKAASETPPLIEWQP